jgi:hypothetical protein
LFAPESSTATDAVGYRRSPITLAGKRELCEGIATHTIRSMARANSKRPPPSPLQSAYRRALSASVVAHARYLAAHADKSITPHYLAQQKAAWQSMEARKAKIQAYVMLAGDEKGPSG